MRVQLWIWALATLSLATSTIASDVTSDVGGGLERGDAAWARRAAGHDGHGRARAESIETAIAAYTAALTPPSSTRIRLAIRTVEKRCEINTAIRPRVSPPACI